MLDANIRLVDFKLEFGRLSDGTIHPRPTRFSPDTCRFWDATTGVTSGTRICSAATWAAKPTLTRKS